MKSAPQPPVSFGLFSAILRRDVHMGGLLVLDALSLPLAFHHTHPYRPSSIGRLLMGSKDNAFVRARVLLPALVQALAAPPTLLLMHDKTTFEALTPAFLAAQPTLLIAEGKGDPLPSPGDQTPQEDGSLVAQLYDVGPPLHLWGENAAQWMEPLMAFVRHGDFMESFGHIDQALQTQFDEEVRKEG